MINLGIGISELENKETKEITSEIKTWFAEENR